jgi:nucleolar GTP-binding protein
MPKARDNEERGAFIPESVLAEQAMGMEKARPSRLGYGVAKGDAVDASGAAAKPAKKTERDLMWENGGPGVYSMDYRKNYLLSNDDYRFDIIPEIMDGKNIADFIDPDIEAKLAALEAEEDQLAAEYEAAHMGEDPESDLDSEEEATVAAIREKKGKMRVVSQIERGSAQMPRAFRGRQKDSHDGEAPLTTKGIKKSLEAVGVPSDRVVERGRKRERSVDAGRGAAARMMDHGEDMDEDTDRNGDIEGMSVGAKKRARAAKKEEEKEEASRSRSHSRPRQPAEIGLKDKAMEKLATKKMMKGRAAFDGSSGEGDHRQTVHLVKWCNSGKSNGFKSHSR